MQKYKGKIMPARRHSGYAYPIGSPRIMSGGMKRKRERDGRETGVRMKVTPVPSALCASAFEACDGRKGGTCSNSSIFGVQDDISDLLLVYRN